VEIYWSAIAAANSLAAADVLREEFCGSPNKAAWPPTSDNMPTSAIPIKRWSTSFGGACSGAIRSGDSHGSAAGKVQSRFCSRAQRGIPARRKTGRKAAAEAEGKRTDGGDAGAGAG